MKSKVKKVIFLITAIAHAFVYSYILKSNTTNYNEVVAFSMASMGMPYWFSLVLAFFEILLIIWFTVNVLINKITTYFYNQKR